MKRLNGTYIMQLADKALHNNNAHQAIMSLQTIAKHNSDQFSTLAPFDYMAHKSHANHQDVQELIHWIYNQMSHYSFRVIDPMMKKINKQGKLSLAFIKEIIKRAKKLKNSSHALLLLAQVTAHNSDWFSKQIRAQIQKYMIKDKIALDEIQFIATKMQQQLAKEFQPKQPKHVLPELETDIRQNINNVHLIDNIYALEEADKRDSGTNLASYMPFTMDDGTIPYHPEEEVDLNSFYLSIALGLMQKYQIDASKNLKIMQNIILASRFILQHTQANVDEVTQGRPNEDYKYAMKAQKDLDKSHA